MDSDLIPLYYFKITDLWKRLCEDHKQLYEYTQDEYMLLLSGNIDDIDDILIKKTSIIDRINHLEKNRSEIIDEINNKFPESNIVDTSSLILFMKSSSLETENKHLYNFNKLLIDIIEKLREQNKKNQLFINKALISLQEIRENAAGLKGHRIYNSKGSTNARLTPNR